ncbi:MAG: cellulase family glycosylhydrolase [Clostridiales bacterium]|jgi:hypothetical protein|nr:cellulase family glycosylhydrolase [Clostridiales bacterium]
MKKLPLTLLSLLFLLPLFAGCGDGGGGGGETPPPDKTGPGYTIEREKYFYGFGEPSATNDFPFLSSTDNIVRSVDLAAETGMQTYRLWMHTGDGLINTNSQNQVSLNASGVAYYHTFVDALKAKGITNIVAMSHYYQYPAGYPRDGFTMGQFPAPDSPYYEPFMKIVEDTFRLLAAEFPDVKYWECGNEINANDYCHKGGGFWNDKSDPAYLYKLDDKIQIGADLMYFATKGIRAGNPDAVSVMPGLVFNNANVETPTATATVGLRPYLRRLYALIESGTCPSVGTETSKNTDDYFDVLNWHPYNFGGNSAAGTSFTLLNDQAYDIAKEHGDDGKKVFFTEYGYTTTEQSNAAAAREAKEKAQGGYIAADMENIWNNLPYVETVIIFRLYDWEGGASDQIANNIEIGFGLFTDPTQPDGPRPKKIAVELQRKIRGANADKEALFKYYTGDRPDWL